MSTCQDLLANFPRRTLRLPYLRAVLVGVHLGRGHADTGVGHVGWRMLAGRQTEGNSRPVNRLQRLIRERADERGWSLAHVGTRAGLHRQTVYKLMRAEGFKQLPDEETLTKLAHGLDLPLRLLREAAVESIGIRIYDEPVADPDTKVVIATMEKLTPARRRAIRKMVEAMTEDYLGGDG